MLVKLCSSAGVEWCLSCSSVVDSNGAIGFVYDSTSTVRRGLDWTVTHFGPVDHRGSLRDGVLTLDRRVVARDVVVLTRRRTAESTGASAGARPRYDSE